MQTFKVPASRCHQDNGVPHRTDCYRPDYHAMLDALPQPYKQEFASSNDWQKAWPALLPPLCCYLGCEKDKPSTDALYAHANWN